LFDAQGAGKIKFNNIEGTGLLFNVNTSTTSTVNVIVAPDGDVTKNCLTMDVYKNGSEYCPFIGSQGPVGISWNRFYVSPDTTAKTRIGYQFGLGSDAYNTDMYGNVNASGSLSVGNAQIIDSSGNITCANINTYKPCGFQSLGKGMICGDISSGGTLGANTGGFTSVSRSATGQYLVTLNATTCYGATANLMGVGLYGFITLEKQTSAQYLVVIRTAGGSGQDSDFGFSCAFR
jgi:hypothetical protein